MNTETKACPSSVADLESQLTDLISFLEYENAYTADPKTEKRIRTKLTELGIWPNNSKISPNAKSS